MPSVIRHGRSGFLFPYRFGIGDGESGGKAHGTHFQAEEGAARIGLRIHCIPCMSFSLQSSLGVHSSLTILANAERIASHRVAALLP